VKKEDLVGVWKFVGYPEEKIHTSKTHIVVQENILWEVWPNTIYYENDPGPDVEYTFKEGTPSKLSLGSGFKYLVRKNGDRLQMKLGPIFGQYPESFDDRGTLSEYTLEKDEISKVLNILPEKVKVEEYKLRGFGTLKYDSNLEWWEGKTKFQGEKLILNIAAYEETKFDPLENLKERLQKIDKLNFSEIAANHLLELFNNSWNENDKDLNHEEFEKKISLNSITLEIDGGASIWLRDGDLFAGHSIQITLNPYNKVADVGIMG
jgi:hypothetical protein